MKRSSHLARSIAVCLVGGSSQLHKALELKAIEVVEAAPELQIVHHNGRSRGTGKGRNKKKIVGRK